MLGESNAEGEQLTKNLRILISQRDQLSNSMADKAHLIEKLIDNNTVLSRRLQSAQREAVKLIALTKKQIEET